MTHSAFPAGRLRPGHSATPEADRLPLLPSGSDGVHGAPPRRTRSSTSNLLDSVGWARPQARSYAPL